jgi:hypothetical protein
LLIEPNDRWEKALIPIALQNLTSRHPELDIQVNYTILPYDDAREQMLKTMLTPSVRTYLKSLVLSNIDRYFNQIIYKRVRSERPSNEEINTQVRTKIDGSTFD